ATPDRQPPRAIARLWWCAEEDPSPALRAPSPVVGYGSSVHEPYPTSPATSVTDGTPRSAGRGDRAAAPGNRDEHAAGSRPPFPRARARVGSHGRSDHGWARAMALVDVWGEG